MTRHHGRMRGPVLSLVLIFASLAVLILVQRSGCVAVKAGVVTHVYDGDTVEVAGVGKVRLLGIDALDSWNRDRASEQSRRLGIPIGSVENWSERATDFAREALLNRKVSLAFGPEREDSYGRILAYVHCGQGGPGDGPNFNALLIEKGLALAYRRFEHPMKAQFIKAEMRARTQKVGLWAEVNEQIQP